MTWTQHTIGLAAVFVGNAIFSLCLFAICRGHTDEPVQTQTQTILIDPDRQRSALIESIAKDHHARLQQSGSRP